MPASIAWATAVGMRAMSAPSWGNRPVSMMSAPVTKNAPTATGQLPTAAADDPSSADPGVDQAIVIGVRVVAARVMVASPIITLTASSPLDAWVVVAPTAVSPVSTTTNELV